MRNAGSIQTCSAFATPRSRILARTRRCAGKENEKKTVRPRARESESSRCSNVYLAPLYSYRRILSIKSWLRNDTADSYSFRHSYAPESWNGDLYYANRGRGVRREQGGERSLILNRRRFPFPDRRVWGEPGEARRALRTRDPVFASEFARPAALGANRRQAGETASLHARKFRCEQLIPEWITASLFPMKKPSWFASFSRTG